MLPPDWRFEMTKLTARRVLYTIKGDKRIDQTVEWDEPGKAIIWLNEGWTWNALDGNRTVEGFILLGNRWEPADTISYLKQCIKNIEPIV